MCGVTKHRSSRPSHANFPFWVAVIRGFRRKVVYFRQLMLSCDQSPLIGINFAYLLRKTLVKWYELRVQLTNQGHFSKLLKRVLWKHWAILPHFRRAVSSDCSLDLRIERVLIASFGGQVTPK